MMIEHDEVIMDIGFHPLVPWCGMALNLEWYQEEPNVEDAWAPMYFLSIDSIWKDFETLGDDTFEDFTKFFTMVDQHEALHATFNMLGFVDVTGWSVGGFILEESRHHKMMEEMGVAVESIDFLREDENDHFI